MILTDILLVIIAVELAVIAFVPYLIKDKDYENLIKMAAEQLHTIGYNQAQSKIKKRIREKK